MIYPSTNPAILTALTTTSDTIDWGVIKQNAVMQVTSLAGSPSSFSAQLEGSSDGTNFFNLGAAVITSGVEVTVTTTAYRYQKVGLTFVGGTSPSATIVAGCF